MVEQVKKALRWGYKGVEVWNFLASFGLTVMLGKFLSPYFEGWVWYDHLIFWGAFALVILALLIRFFPNKVQAKGIEKERLQAELQFTTRYGWLEGLVNNQ